MPSSPVLDLCEKKKKKKEPLNSISWNSSDYDGDNVADDGDDSSTLAIPPAPPPPHPSTVTGGASSTWPTNSSSSISPFRSEEMLFKTVLSYAKHVPVTLYYYYYYWQ